MSVHSQPWALQGRGYPPQLPACTHAVQTFSPLDDGVYPTWDFAFAFALAEPQQAPLSPALTLQFLPLQNRVHPLPVSRPEDVKTQPHHQCPKTFSSLPVRLQPMDDYVLHFSLASQVFAVHPPTLNLLSSASMRS